MSTRTARPGSPRGRSVHEVRRSVPPAAPTVALHGPDISYLIALGLLVSIGIIMVYSATAVESELRDLIKLGIGLVLGVGLLVLTYHSTEKRLRAITQVFLFVCIAALAALWWKSAPYAVTVNGATRWIGLKGLLTLQPSEYAKLAFVLFAAQFLDRYASRMTWQAPRLWGAFLGVLALLGALIYKEPDLGTALVLGGTAFCMLLVAGIDWKILGVGIVVVGVVVFLLAWTTDHQRARLDAWLNPWAQEHRRDGGHQVIQSWAALAKGGWTGVGLGQSTHKLNNRLPESETDFIFAIAGEELGAVRAIGVVALFGILAWRGFAIAARAPNRYQGLVVAGITAWVAVQSTLNIAVVTGTVPNTGVPLPFISAGLSSLTALLAAGGIVASISRRTRLPEGKRPLD